MEAMEQLKAGKKFSDVATQLSEDKARQGVRFLFTFIHCSTELHQVIGSCFTRFLFYVVISL